MNQNSVVYYHKEKCNCKEIFDICTKLKLHIFECDKLDILAYIMEKISPMYVIFDGNVNLNQNILEDFATHNKNAFIYLLNKNFLSLGNNHTFIVENFKNLEIVLSNHYRCFSNHNIIDEQNQTLCYKIVHNELDNLSFRSKLIGSKYMADLIYELYANSSISHGKCNSTYDKLALKYNTSSYSIEKSIRFCILRAYQSCQNKNLFYNISKTKKAPSIKEVANFILDKIYLNLNNNHS